MKDGGMRDIFKVGDLVKVLDTPESRKALIDAGIVNSYDVLLGKTFYAERVDIDERSVFICSWHVPFCCIEPANPEERCIMKDGGPFHPMPGETRRVHDGGNHWDDMSTPGYAGISLRDWFAGMAMNSLIANESMMQAIGTTNKTPESIIAKMAYDMADAMLKAREEKR